MGVPVCGWDWLESERRANSDGLFFNLLADGFLMTSTEGFLGTNGINFTSFFLRNFASNMTTNLAKTVSGTTGAGLSFATPVLKCLVSKPKSVMWEAKT